MGGEHTALGDDPEPAYDYDTDSWYIPQKTPGYRGRRRKPSRLKELLKEIAWRLGS